MIQILVIDDEPVVLNFLEQSLKSVVSKVFTASCGTESIDIINKENLDAVFVDLMLDDMDGLDIIKATKKKNPETVIIVVSAKKDDPTIAKSFQLGATEFLPKPYEAEYLREIIAKHINKVKIAKKNHIEKPNILICDDEEEIQIFVQRFIMRRFLSNVDISANGKEAIEMIKSKNYDIILMDLKMPGLSGLETIKEIKKLKPKSEFLIISAVRDATIIAQCIEAGALDYLSKPLSREILAARLKNILEKKNKLIERYIEE